MSYYAHTNELDKSKWQTIKDHLSNTAGLARQLGADAGLSDYAFIAALLHDIGKYSQDFQKKLDGAHIKVDHSTAGAQEVLKLFKTDPYQKLLATMLSYCIAGHHGGLPDYGSEIDLETDASLKARLKRTLEDYSAYTTEIDTAKLVLPARLPIRPIKDYPGFSLAFFTRMLYSILVDADFQDTETFMNKGEKPRGGYPSIQMLCQEFNQFLKQFNAPQNPIDQKRTDILQACIAKAAEKPGLFTLTVPTGGGKTFASMAFALHHAVAHGLKRIIYVIPYTTIIEQNAGKFKESLGNENVLEHHSNFDWKRDTKTEDDDTNSILNKLKLATENWDIPIVVTTNVQFFESLFANRSSRCRKLHNIAKSVLIFDETQMLPREYLKPCLFAVCELVRNYGASAVFCTATQPELGKFLPEGSKLQELAPDPQALYSFYKRVQVKNLDKLPDEELIQRINEQPQVLCIVNTRKHAKGLFDAVVNEGRFHLSTLMCPVHRKETIATIRERLIHGLPCRVISTQIMEAGIDVDFPVGYRALAGLDSIIQAAGRVNREGKQAAGGSLYVFEPDSEFIKRTPAYIQQGADVARSTLRKYAEDPVCIEAIQAYYGQLYDLQGENAFDAKGTIDCFEKGIHDEVAFDFKTAAEKFELINAATKPVIIQYDPTVQAILKNVQASAFPGSFSRALQLYTVNIYDQEFEALQNQGKIDVYGETYAVLNDMENYYNPETGLVIPENSSGNGIFF